MRGRLGVPVMLNTDKCDLQDILVAARIKVGGPCFVGDREA